MALESGDTLGVTFQHPIYTRSGWTAAGLLEVGEEVLTYNGYVKVADVSRLEGLHPVYNLEVKDLHNFLVGDVGVVVYNGYNILDCFKIATNYLSKGARYLSNGVGTYKAVRGHHPIAKALFKGHFKGKDYDDFINNAWSVAASKLDEITGVANNHLGVITPKQGKLYRDWVANNPNKTLTFSDVIDIEKAAMVHAKIPEDIAQGLLVQSIEKLQELGATKITFIPFANIVNP